MRKLEPHFKEILSYRNTPGNEIVDQFANMTETRFDHVNGIPVVTGSYDGKDLPLLLTALSRSSIALAPIVVDNRPGNGVIREHAEAMGAVVIDQEVPGQMSAVRTGIEYAAENHSDKPMLITDDDTLPLAYWAETLIRQARLHRELGGIAYGGVILGHGESRLTDGLRTAYALATNMRRRVTHSSPKARGPNGILMLDEHDRILEELRTKAPNAFPCDVSLKESVEAVGGEIKSVLHPKAMVFTRGDRFNSIGSLAKDLVERGKNRAALYEDQK